MDSWVDGKEIMSGRMIYIVFICCRESLEYSQRFVTKTCVDTIAAGIKTRKPTAEEVCDKKKSKFENMYIHMY